MIATATEMFDDKRLPTDAELLAAAEILYYAAQNGGEGATGVNGDEYVVLLAVRGDNDQLCLALDDLYGQQFGPGE